MFRSTAQMNKAKPLNPGTQKVKHLHLVLLNPLPLPLPLRGSVVAMSTSSDDVFYSARDSSPSNSNLSQNQHHPLSPPLNTNLDSCADQNQHLTPPSDKWLVRIASSAGHIISSVLGLSDGSGSDDEFDEEVAETPTVYEEKYEFGERIKKLNQGMALGQVEEPKAIIPLTKSEEPVTQETISREQSGKPINPVQSQVVEFSSPFIHLKNVSSHNHLVQTPLSPVQTSLEIHSVTVSEAKKWCEENKSTSSSFTLPLNPNISPSPCQDQQSLSKIIPHVNPLPSPSPTQNQQPPQSSIVPPVNLLPSSSLSKNQQQPSDSLPPLLPNAALSCTNQKQKSPHSLIPRPEKRSKPCSNRNQPSLKCPLTSSNHKKVLNKETQDLIFDPMVEEGSGTNRMPSNLKEVIELFSGDLNAKELVNVDLLDALEMKGITFEDPSWWPK